MEHQNSNQMLTNLEAKVEIFIQNWKSIINYINFENPKSKIEKKNKTKMKQKIETRKLKTAY